MSQTADRSAAEGVNTPRDTDQGWASGGSAPAAYVTTADLAALWDQRSRQMAAYRQEHPDDLPGIERRQRQVSRAWQAYRLLSEIEQQLGLLVALPVLGPVPQLPDEGEH